MAREPRYLALTAMIFAVAMMFIDQTIVSIAVPDIDRDLQLSRTGAQWIINGYLLALAALFALAGKVSDVLGHRRTVMAGVAGFAITSALCGAAPSGSGGEAWLIVFRVARGAFGALLFPAALAIVAAAFEPRERGRALAIFFGITGALTSVGPLAGGVLIEWTWRSIFWINVPIAVIALLLCRVVGLQDERRDTTIDRRGAFELETPAPLIELRIFTYRGFAADNLVLFALCVCFVPLFFFASVYAQAVLHDSAGAAGLYLGIFFLGFASASQIGGRILDARGARPTALAGAVVTAVGFLLLAGSLPEARLATQWYWLMLTGAGMGLILGLAILGTVFSDRIGDGITVASATQTVYRAMAGVMIACLLIGAIGMRRGRAIDAAAAA